MEYLYSMSSRIMSLGRELPINSCQGIKEYHIRFNQNGDEA